MKSITFSVLVFLCFSLLFCKPASANYTIFEEYQPYAVSTPFRVDGIQSDQWLRKTGRPGKAFFPDAKILKGIENPFSNPFSSVYFDLLVFEEVFDISTRRENIEPVQNKRGSTRYKERITITGHGKTIVLLEGTNGGFYVAANGTTYVQAQGLAEQLGGGINFSESGLPNLISRKFAVPPVKRSHDGDFKVNAGQSLANKTVRLTIECPWGEHYAPPEGWDATGRFYTVEYPGAHIELRLRADSNGTISIPLDIRGEWQGDGADLDPPSKDNVFVFAKRGTYTVLFRGIKTYNIEY